MLDKLRQSTKGVLAYILIGLLVVAFAVWGIADIFTGGGDQPVATVGDIEISQADFDRSYRNQQRFYQDQLNRDLGSEELRALGIDRTVLARLINGALADNHAITLGLGVTDETIAQSIRNDPAFLGLDGKFDRSRLQDLLTLSGLSEPAYIALKKRELLRQQITDSLTLDIPVPKLLVDLTGQYQFEKRKLRYIVLDEKVVGPLAEPDDKTLKDFHQLMKANYMAPEYRKIGLIILTPKTLAPKMEVSEEEIKAKYAEVKQSFNTPEKRRIQQIVFPDEKAAATARKKIRRSKDFIAIAKKQGQTLKDIDLGLLAKSDLIDPAIAEAAFTLKKGQISQPIKGQFNTVILRVSKIVPAVNKTLDQVKDQVKAMIAKEKAVHHINELQDSIEEERAAGTPLNEIAEKLGLEYVEISAIDRHGRDPKGKTVALIASTPRIVSEAFKAEAGEEIEAIPTDENGLAWVEVLDITEAELKPFESVKAEVLKDWREQTLRTKLGELAAKLVAQSKPSKTRPAKSFEEIAGSVKRKIITTKPFTRDKLPPPLPRSAATLIFTLAKNAVSSTPSADGKTRLVFQVIEIIPAEKLKPDAAKKISDALKKQLTYDILAGYFNGLRKQYPVEVNRSVFDRLTGR